MNRREFLVKSCAGIIGAGMAAGFCCATGSNSVSLPGNDGIGSLEASTGARELRYRALGKTGKSLLHGRTNVDEHRKSCNRSL